jgi:hypothetical protein
MRNLITYPALLTYSALLIAFSASLTFAQTVSGGMTGPVMDATGATLPNARIELQNIETGQRITTTSDANGNFRIADIPAGRYRIVTSSSSATPTTPGQEITIDTSRTSTINITIPSGPGTDAVPTAETVNVTTKPSSIQNVYNTRSSTIYPRRTSWIVTGWRSALTTWEFSVRRRTTHPWDGRAEWRSADKGRTPTCSTSMAWITTTC